MEGFRVGGIWRDGDAWMSTGAKMMDADSRLRFTGSLLADLGIG